MDVKAVSGLLANVAIPGRYVCRYVVKETR